MLQRYLVAWLCLTSALAYYWPKILGLSSAPPPAWLADPWLLSKPSLWGLIALTMFAIGYMLPRDEVRQVARRWPTVLGGTALQYTTMPLIAYVVANALRLQSDALIGIMVVGCVPGAMASNVLTLNARGNTSYSVSLTTSATVLSPLVVPFALWLTLGEAVPYDPVDMAVNLAVTIVLPVVAGHLVRRSVRRGEAWARPVASAVANLAILLIIAAVVGSYRRYLDAQAARFVLPLLLVNVGGYLAGYAGGFVMRLPEPMRRALTLEVGMQNAGVGTVLAVTYFPQHPHAAILPAAYTFGCMLTGTILAHGWAMISERNERRAAAAAD